MSKFLRAIIVLCIQAEVNVNSQPWEKNLLLPSTPSPPTPSPKKKRNGNISWIIYNVTNICLTSVKIFCSQFLVVGLHSEILQISRLTLNDPTSVPWAIEITVTLPMACNCFNVNLAHYCILTSFTLIFLGNSVVYHRDKW